MGRGALEGYYSDQFRQGAGNLKLEVGEVSGHGPLAYQTGVYELDYRRDSRHDRGKYLFVLRNMSGTWRLQYAMWSSDLPVEDAQAKTD